MEKACDNKPRSPNLDLIPGSLDVAQWPGALSHSRNRGEGPLQGRRRIPNPPPTRGQTPHLHSRGLPHCPPPTAGSPRGRSTPPSGEGPPGIPPKEAGQPTARREGTRTRLEHRPTAVPTRPPGGREIRRTDNDRRKGEGEDCLTRLHFKWPAL